MSKPDMKIKINGDASGAKRALKDVGAATEHTMGKVIAAAAVFTSAFQSFDKLIDVNRKFEVINASLVTVTGSAVAASVAFSRIQSFAATTPFQLNEVADAFIKLKALGLDPSEHAMKSYGNTAAAMGKSLNQMIEAVADASTGEFERLKEFGIKASQHGDKVSFTFRGVTTTVAKSSADIQKYLLNIGDVDFAGAMKMRADSLDGALSNLSDSWDNLFIVIGKSGATSLMKDMAVYFADAAKGASKLIQVLSNADNQSALAIQITDTQEKIKRLKKSVQEYNNQRFHPFEAIFGNPNEDTFTKLQEYEDKLKSLSERRQKILEQNAAVNSGADTSKGSDASSSSGKDSGAAALAAKRASRELEANQTKLNRLMEQQAAFNQHLGLQADLAFADEAQREDIRFQDKLAKIQERFALITENTVATDQQKLEAKSIYLEQVASLEEIHSARIIEMKQREADAINSNSEKTNSIVLSASKFRESIDKKQYGESIAMAAGYLKQSGMLNKKQFEQVKAVETAVAIVNGISTVLAAIKHGSQVGGIYGAVIEGAAATAMVVAQISQIQKASFSGGSNSIPTAPGGGTSAGAMGGGNIPSFQPQAQQQTNQQQAPQINITVQALHPDAISPDTVQMIMDGFAPALYDSFGRGQHLAVQAA